MIFERWIFCIIDYRFSQPILGLAKIVDDVWGMVVYRLADYQQLLIYNRGISGEEV